MGTGAEPPKPHPRYAWLPAFLPADARRFRVDDEELKQALAASGAEITEDLDVDVEIATLPSAVEGVGACAFVQLDRAEGDATGTRAARLGRRASRSLRLRADIRAARRTLSGRGYDQLHVATWDRPRDPYVELPGNHGRPRSLASLLPRHALIGGYRGVRPITYVEAAVAAAGAGNEVPKVRSALVAGSGIIVLAGQRTVLRIGAGPAARLVEAEVVALDALWRVSPSPFVARRVPRPLTNGAHGLGAWSLEARVAGSPTRPPYSQQFLDDCIEFLAELSALEGGSTARPLRADAAVLGQWCSEETADALAALADEVDAALAGVRRGFGHGDFAAGNLLGQGDGLAGVVDWARGGAGRLTLLDLLHLRANIEATRARVHLGEAIVHFLLPWARSGGDRLLDSYCERAGVELTKPQLEAAAVAYWFDFIASELHSFADRGQRRVWVEKNVRLVADHLLARSGRTKHEESPRVAAVVPCFNDGATVTDTVDSLRAQEQCELVVVDDGSDDEQTLAVLAELETDGVQVVRQENRGPAGARMAGVRATTAPYVFAIDADDVVAPGALTALADALDDDPNAVAAWGDTEMFGDANARLPKARTLDPWQITYVNPVPTTALIRREALLQVGGWQLEAGYEDWDLWMAFAERGWRGVHLERTVVRHRLHGARRWSRDFERHLEIEQELRRRHEALFARRGRNWLRSRAPWRSRLLLPIVFALPLLPPVLRFRLAVLIGNPVVVPRLWLQARRAAFNSRTHAGSQRRR